MIKVFAKCILPLFLGSCVLLMNTCRSNDVTLYEWCPSTSNMVCLSSDTLSPDLTLVRAVPNNYFDVIVIMGQSNTLAGPGYDSLLDGGHDRIFQLGRYEDDLKVVKAQEPLQHHEIIPGHIGFAMTFCKWYMKTFLSADRNILIIPCGKGGSGYNDQNWNRGDDLYVDALNRINFVLKQFPQSELKAVLWHQGEDDEDYPFFQNSLDSMITHLRKDVLRDQSFPFLLGGMVPYWVDKSKKRQIQECILRDTPNRNSHCVFADPRVPCLISKTDNETDEIHYNANGQRMLGLRYYNAYLRFIKGP